MNYAQPKQLDQALDLLASGSWSILAGGTDFYPGLRDQMPSGDVLDIYDLDVLRAIEDTGDFLRIGALVTWSDLAAADLAPAFDGLKLAALEVGSIQIQNRATVAGNLCNASPAADGVPPLLTLNAEVELVSAIGKRQLPLQSFILGNRKTSLKSNELLSAVLIPKQALSGNSTFLKLGARKYLVISISMVAARLVCDAQSLIVDAAVSVGSCSLVATRLPTLEQALVGQSAATDLGELVEQQHIALLSPIDDVRASKAYRLDASLELLRRALRTVGREYA